MMEIYEGLKHCLENKERAVLATIIEVDGSTYRREGASCFITEDGKVLGTVSAGCVEGDLFEHARDVLESGRARTQHYDFRSEEDLLWGMGVGCNGAMKILLQPFDPVRYPAYTNHVFQMYEKKAFCRKEFIVGIVIDTADPSTHQIGTPYIFEQDERSTPRIRNGSRGLVHWELKGVQVTLYVETVQPRPMLVVYGAGPDAIPLVQGASRLGWHVTLIDHREHALCHQAFASADRLQLISREDYGNLYVDENAYVVVMTHNYLLDAKVVKRMIDSTIPYLGVLGPRKRIERILQEINTEQKRPIVVDFAKLHAPIGLDIGADSPEEIALSILAELTSCRNRRGGQSLRLRNEPLHERHEFVSEKVLAQR